ncbi:RNA polymerase sigma factor [Winogradskya humida]|uniref:RNA polymerase subunit sigma-24 n=1 Tax=Winogradskya humida TaxID=113566 RepID=A0ABQ3ZNR6_9ACTN|nr:RNA polymerase sigma factor [Actinoplanes humidus]GIE20235.1 RNA polymerase subunit sigma-24 [Actinoplanes humidus]
MTDPIGDVHRAEYGRAVAVLTRYLGDLDLAEEAVQDAFTVAAERWPQDGLPPSPAGWIITTARNRAVDRLRREAVRGEKEAEAVRIRGDEPPSDHEDLLRLIFTCCHPALRQEARVALTLRLLGGLSTPAIAAAFLVPEPTMAQRIVRAKAKIRDAGIPYRVPGDDELTQRLQPVLAVLYLIFNEGYAVSSGPALTRDDLCTEAIRLARMLVGLMPAEPEAQGLLALMLLIAARRPARTTVDGALIRLGDQNRSMWDRALLEEGQAIVRTCVQLSRPGAYQIQAAVNAVHSIAPTAPATDWAAILTLYDQLMALTPTAVVALNRAVALAEVHGPAPALEIVDSLPLDGYYVFHTVRAELLSALSRKQEATSEFERAAAATGNEAEHAYLLRRSRLG